MEYIRPLPVNVELQQIAAYNSTKKTNCSIWATIQSYLTVLLLLALVEMELPLI
jgi:hypothetical protein